MDEDTHLCLRCQQLVVGLNNYVSHRSRSCLPSAPPVVQSCWSQDAGRHSEPGDNLTSEPDFFSSLELKSAEPKSTVTTDFVPDQYTDSDQSEDEVRHNKSAERTVREGSMPPSAHTGGKWKPGFSQDHSEDEDDLYPPRSHTSGKWKPGTRPDLTNEIWLVRSSSPDMETSSYTCLPEQAIENEQPPCQDSFNTLGRKSNCKSLQRITSWKQLACVQCKMAFRNEAELGIHLFSSSHVSTSVNCNIWLEEVLSFQEFFKGLLPYQCAICRFHLLREIDFCAHFLHRDHFTDKYRTVLCLTCCEQCSSSEELLVHLASPEHKVSASKTSHPVVIMKTKMRIYCVFCDGKCKLLPRTSYSAYKKPVLVTRTNGKADDEESASPANKSVRKRIRNDRLDSSDLTIARKEYVKRSDGKEYSCGECSFRTVTKFRLNRHVATHDKDRERTFICEVCGLSVLSRLSLLRHAKRHGAKSHSCSECRMSFYTSNELADHIARLHSDSRPHLCHICGYTSKTKQVLQRHHRRLHSSKKQACTRPGCKFAATFDYEMTQHMRSHTGKKPYKCPYCKYKTHFQGNLRSHVLNTKKHRGKNVYPCRECKFGTDDCVQFNLHMNEAHPRRGMNLFHEGEVNTVLGSDLES